MNTSDNPNGCHWYAPTATLSNYLPWIPQRQQPVVVRLNQTKPPMQWRGYKPTTLSSEGICACAQPLLVERLKNLIHAVMKI